MTRCVSLLGVVGLAALAMLTPGCAEEFDSARHAEKRGSVGEEIYGVLCDRVGAQALREDMTGDSFRGLCHRVGGADFKDKVDESKLPALAAGAKDEQGNVVPMEKQRADRDKAIGKIESMARRRVDLVRALDATFPGDEKVAIKDIRNGDDAKTCNAPAKSGEGLLVDEIADMLGRMGELYTDGTIPQSTESLAKVMTAFQKDEAAQKAWARMTSRQGYRPIETALGATRPMIAYPRLRDFSNASLRLLSADSDPYQRDPKRYPDGTRVPVPGPGNAALVKMLEASQAEMLDTKYDDDDRKKRLARAVLKSTPDAMNRSILTRPRENLEMLQEILFFSDASFGGGTSQFIVKRDPRGYAAIAGGQVPAPFVDADKDGLPDVDDEGRFQTTNASLAPSPFPFPGGVDGARDQFGRALAGTQPLYDYLDTTHTFAAQMMSDMKPLVNPDPEAKHATLMDMMSGLTIAMGPRAQVTKSYPVAGASVTYDGVDVKSSPMMDLVYAMGALLGDKTMPTTLELTNQLFTQKNKEVARVAGSLITAYDVAHAHPEAKIAKESTFWDENMDVLQGIAQEEGLLEDLLLALADPATQDLGNIMSKYAKNRDEMTYDRNNLNGPAYNLTTKSVTEPRTPVDRSQPNTGANRSAMYRFLLAVNDTIGVTACNKPNAKLHIELGGFSLPNLPLSFKECELFKIENLAAFYLDAIANASQYDSGDNPRGAIYMRPSLLRGGGLLNLADVISGSSGLKGMWPTKGTIVAPQPEFLNRLVFFDLANDTQNPKTKLFIADLQGEHVGTAVCPERIIDDPSPDAIDASPDKKVHGLRNCPNGQWMTERNPNALFPWEQYGFYGAMRPLLGAFVKHRREDLFLQLTAATAKAWPGQEASVEDCRMPNGKSCPKANMQSYEAFIAEAFAGDVLPAISALMKELENLPVTRCDAADPKTGACLPGKTTQIRGIDAVAAATRSAFGLDPYTPDHATVVSGKPKGYAKLPTRQSRTGAVIKRNDGSPQANVTPAHLLTAALNGIDQAFDDFEATHVDDKGERRASWRRARSQLVDQFMGVKGARTTSAFANPAMTKMTPKLVDVIRAQLIANCPQSFTPPYAKCEWATTQLSKKAEESMGGPLMATGLDVMEAISTDPESRRQTNLLLAYLVDAASKNDALASMIATSNDMVQLLGDDENLVPLYHLLAQAVGPSVKDKNGRVTEKSLVDAQMALLSRISGKYFDDKGVEICKREIDPNQVLAVALGHLVTPIKDADFKGQTPLEVIIDVIADVNRQDPTQKYEGTLAKDDYAAVSKNVSEFLLDPERGLEQFYEVIRNGMGN